MLIRDVIRNREPYSTKSSATVQEAAEFMATRNIGAVCVVDEDGRLIGVFSELHTFCFGFLPLACHAEIKYADDPADNDQGGHEYEANTTDNNMLRPYHFGFFTRAAGARLVFLRP